MARKLKVELDVDSRDGVRSVQKVTRSIDKMDKESKRAGRNMTATFSKAKVGLVAIGVAAVAATAKMVSMSKNIIDYGDNLHKLNIRLGVSVNTLDKLRKIGALAGVEFKTITNSIQRLTVRVQEAGMGIGLAQDAFKYLKIEIKELKKLSPEDQFKLVAERIGMVTDKSIQNKVAYDLMGRSGGTLITMFKNLNIELQKMNSSMTQDSVEAMARFNDTMQKLSDQIQDYLIDPITKAVEGITELIEILQGKKSGGLKLDPNAAIKPGFDKYLNKFYTKKPDTPEFGENYSPISQKTSMKSGTKTGASIIPDWYIEQEQLDAIKGDLSSWFSEIEAEEDELTEKIREENDKRKEILENQFGDMKKFREADLESMREYTDYKKEIDQQYADEKIALEKQINEMFADGMTDALFDWIDGTKSASDAFKEFASSFLKQIAKMIIQQAILNAISSRGGGGGIGGFFSSFFGGAKAGGGPVSGNKSYMVGEEGPELFTPGTSGAITPNDKLGGGDSSITVVNNIQIEASGNDQQDETLAKRTASAIEAKIKEVIGMEKRYGGLLYG